MYAAHTNTCADVGKARLLQHAGVKLHLWSQQKLCLENKGLITVADGKLVGASALSGEAHQRKVQSWIFTPSFQRSSTRAGKRQAFLDWNQAMPDTAYVRVIVVQQVDVQEYSCLVARLGQLRSLPCTIIMELPEVLDLTPLGDSLSPTYQTALSGRSLSSKNGVGYARLCIQLVAHALQLSDIWMLDDSIQDCWRLNLEAESLKQQPPQHGDLDPCSFFSVMSTIEQHVAATLKPSPATEPMFNPGHRTWDPAISPRKKTTEHVAKGQVLHAYDLSGSHAHVGVIGLNRQPYRHKLVGATWNEGQRRGPSPFKVTHSVYSFFLLNVASTCSKQPMVLWPARQYAEDIEMHHLCEDNQLSVVKRNSLFFHKAKLQGPAAVRAKAQLQEQVPEVVSICPAQGPMWSCQRIEVRVQHAQAGTTVRVCGILAAKAPDSAMEGQQVYTVQLPVMPEYLAACVTPPDARNVVMSGCVSLGCGQSEPLVAPLTFDYEGFRKWGPETHCSCSARKDTGRLESVAQNYDQRKFMCSSALDCVCGIQ